MTFTDTLGARLESEQGQILAANACLCYVCAGNVDKLVDCWNSIHGSNGTPDVLQVINKCTALIPLNIMRGEGVKSLLNNIFGFEV